MPLPEQDLAGLRLPDLADPAQHRDVIIAQRLGGDQRNRGLG
jgi:hypothetical protein